MASVCHQYVIDYDYVYLLFPLEPLVKRKCSMEKPIHLEPESEKTETALSTSIAATPVLDLRVPEAVQRRNPQADAVGSSDSHEEHI